MTLDELRASTSATVTVSDAASVLGGIDPRTVRRAAEAGQLPAVHVGRRLLILREPLLSMLAAESASDTPRLVSTGTGGDCERLPPASGDAA